MRRGLALHSYEDFKICCRASQGRERYLLCAADITGARATPICVPAGGSARGAASRCALLTG
jgi:hypothetical protein